MVLITERGGRRARNDVNRARPSARLRAPSPAFRVERDGFSDFSGSVLGSFGLRAAADNPPPAAGLKPPAEEGFPKL